VRKMGEEADALKIELAKAESQLTHVNEMIAGQRTVIENWERHGWNTSPAADVLQSLERLQEVQTEYRDRMLKKFEAARISRLARSQMHIRL
jgi:hypothetical protein